MPANPVPWEEAEIVMTALRPYENPYTDVDVWVDFTNEDGTTLRRPGFWDGESTWRVRLAAPGVPGVWRWRAACSSNDAGISEACGEIVVDALEGGADHNRFCRRGFWRVSRGRRSLVHADGTGALLVADTAWALPWRATSEEVELYAADRHKKGFNAALLMSIQPDRDARGPRDRGADHGFDVGFEDSNSKCERLRVTVKLQ